MKIILAGGAVLIVILAILFFVLEPASAPNAIDTPEINRPIVADDQPTTTTPSNGRRANPIQTGTTATPDGSVKTATFVGTLQSVNTGCFSDGECYIVVDGKHITAIMGWSQETVGQVLGVEGFGDLENYIGSKIEVYAQATPDNKYTLYGNAGFYIKLVADKGGNTTAAACVIGGCSSQLCTEDTGEPMITTCEFKEVYACYTTATCTRQATGACGWNDTPALKACIATSNTTSGSAL